MQSASANALCSRRLQPVDLLIVAAYLASIILIGVWCRKRQKTTRHYFLAGRQLPPWAIAGSIVATETSAITFVSIPGLAYARGGDFTFLQLVLGYLVGRVVICLLFIPAYFRRSLLTIYELLRGKFGGGVKSLAAILFIVMRTIADAVRLLLTSLVMAAVWRVFDPNIATSTATALSAVIIGAVMLVFTAMGGMEAVVWTEVLHVGVYIIGAIAAVILLTNAIPGGFAGAMRIAAEHHKLRVFDFTPDAARPYVFWAGVIGGCFLNMSTHGTDQYMVQRYLCTTSSRKASGALLASGVVILVQFIAFLTIGALLFAYYHPYTLPGYLTGPAAAPFTTSDQVFPDFIIHHVPSGLCGLIVAAVLAAATSPSTNSIAATAVADIYQPIVRRRSDEHYLRAARILTVVAGIAQVSVALMLLGTPRAAVDTALGVASLINGPILGVFLLARTRRGSPAAAFIGMSAGIAAVTCVWLLTKIAWPWYSVIGSLVTVGVGIVAPAREAEPSVVSHK